MDWGRIPKRRVSKRVFFFSQHSPSDTVLVSTDHAQCSAPLPRGSLLLSPRIRTAHLAVEFVTEMNSIQWLSCDTKLNCANLNSGHCGGVTETEMLSSPSVHFLSAEIRAHGDI